MHEVVLCSADKSIRNFISVIIIIIQITIAVVDIIVAHVADAVANTYKCSEAFIFRVICPEQVRRSRLGCDCGFVSAAGC